MFAVIGTVPLESFPLCHGQAVLSNGHIMIGDQKVPIYRGTPALLAAALKASEAMQGPDIYTFLIGDIGKGVGSRHLYKFLTDNLRDFSFKTIAFHYLQPMIHWHDNVLAVVEQMRPKPLLIADAGFMYAGKMSGNASHYDLFTPDIGELAFLADEEAPHPFYTRGFILHQDDKTLPLINRAYQHRNASRYMLVKGKSDYIVHDDRIIEKVNHPAFEAMEAIGGTGDSLTGLVSLLCSADYPIAEAAILAAKTNRWIGHYAAPSPASQISELIDTIPQALSHVLTKGKET